MLFSYLFSQAVTTFILIIQTTMFAKFLSCHFSFISVCSWVKMKSLLINTEKKAELEV